MQVRPYVLWHKFAVEFTFTPILILQGSLSQTLIVEIRLSVLVHVASLFRTLPYMSVFLTCSLSNSRSQHEQKAQVMYINQILVHTYLKEVPSPLVFSFIFLTLALLTVSTFFSCWDGMSDTLIIDSTPYMHIHNIHNIDITDIIANIDNNTRWLSLVHRITSNENVLVPHVHSYKWIQFSFLITICIYTKKIMIP